MVVLAILGLCTVHRQKGFPMPGNHACILHKFFSPAMHPAHAVWERGTASHAR